MPAIYIAPEVAAIRALYPGLANPAFRAQPIRTQITAQADTLLDAYTRRDTRAAMQLFSWWPRAAGTRLDTLFDPPFAQADAVQTIAREYGFADPDNLPDSPPDAAFEAALDALLSGDIDALTHSLDAGPHLATACSAYGHGATLPHYLGANGVESHRQVVPENAPALAERLIAKGADPRATAHMYGGGQTPLMLAQTSAHPARAGVAEALCAALA
ncbi:MAG: hypothetical protein AAFY38_08735 [Pseudomonadota bacterium]